MRWAYTKTFFVPLPLQYILCWMWSRDHYDIFSNILIPKSRDEDAQEIEEQSNYPYSEYEKEEKVVAS